MISVEHVTKRYHASGHRAEVPVLTDVSIQAEAGEIVGLVGPNGAGKTTLLNIVCGYTTPTSGQVRVLGLDPVRDRIRVVSQLGVALDSSRSLFLPLTARQNLLYLALLRGMGLQVARAQAEASLDRVGATELAHIRCLQLSRGQRQRILLASALLTNPRVLVLDEPTAGLDPTAAEAFGELLLEEANVGRAILVSSHDLGWLEQIATRVILLDRGYVVHSGSPGKASDASRFVWEVRGELANHDRALLVDTGARIRIGSPSNDGAVTIIESCQEDVARVQRIFDVLRGGGYEVHRFRPGGGDLRQIYREVMRLEQEQLLGRLRRQGGSSR